MVLAIGVVVILEDSPFGPKRALDFVDDVGYVGFQCTARLLPPEAWIVVPAEESRSVRSSSLIPTRERNKRRRALRYGGFLEVAAPISSSAWRFVAEI